MHALTTELTILLVEQWAKPRPGGTYLMGRCINGKARIHFNKNTELESEACYPLCLVSGIKAFPPWQVLMHNQLQEDKHCHWGEKHAQQPAKKRGARLLMYNAITHVCRQKNMAGGKKHKVYLSLKNAELPFSFFFLVCVLFFCFDLFLTEITVIPRSRQPLQWEQAAWSPCIVLLWMLWYLTSPFHSSSLGPLIYTLLVSRTTTTAF